MTGILVSKPILVLSVRKIEDGFTVEVQSEFGGKNELFRKTLPEAIETMKTVEDEFQIMEEEDERLNIDIIMTGSARQREDRMEMLLYTVKTIEEKDEMIAPDTLFSAFSAKVKIERKDFDFLTNQMLKEGLLYSPKPGFLKRTTVDLTNALFELIS